MKVLCIAVLALLLAACSRHVELMSAMPEAEANEVLAALQNAGIHADKTPGKEGMVGVSIEAAQVGRAMDLLRAKGLPHERHAGMGQVFKKEGLISSPLEERARYLYALSQELDATLSQIDGVIVARVHVVLPERGQAGDPASPSSAAVFIKYQEGFNLDVLQPQIRRLVNNSIPGLSPEKISIVLFSSQAQAPKPMPPEPAANIALLATLAALAATLLAGGAWFGWRLLHARRRDSGVIDA
jgi:type III secretion protein J